MRTQRATGKVAIALVLVLAMLGISLVATAPVARADHDTIAWSGPTTVASSANFAYSNSWIVADGHGSIYVFYAATNTLASTTNVNVTKYAAVGLGGNPQKLFDKQVNDVSNVVTSNYPISAVIDSSGNLYVAWTRNPVSGNNQVYVSKSANGGVTWQAAKEASSSTSGTSNFWGNIVAAPDGTVYVSWLSESGSAEAVTVAKSTDGGSTFSAGTNATTALSVGINSIAVDSAGRVYVADSFTPSGSSTSVVDVTWSDNGVTWSPHQKVSNPTSSTLFPALFVDSGGLVHLAWYNVVPSGYAIDYVQSRDRGATWSEPLAITPGFTGGYIGYMAGEGDTLMFVRGDFDVTGFGFTLSADHGVTWYPDATLNTGATSLSAVAADQNGTFWATSLDASAHLTLRPWYGPPSRPVIDSVVASGSNGLTITWTPSPEQNVVDYRIWRSADGTNYQAVGLVGGSVTSFTDSGLANGTYYYIVTAINIYGTPSHASTGASGTVGTTTAQLIADLQSQINALENELSQANASTAAAIAAAQAQITSLQNQLTSLQNSQTSANAATAAQLAQLQANLTRLQDQLNTLQGQQATQTISYANLAFEIIVVVLLVVLLLNQMRKPKSPQMMMAQPGHAEPKKPEDDL